MQWSTLSNAFTRSIHSVYIMMHVQSVTLTEYTFTLSIHHDACMFTQCVLLSIHLHSVYITTHACSLSASHSVYIYTQYTSRRMHVHSVTLTQYTFQTSVHQIPRTEAENVYNLRQVCTICNIHSIKCEQKESNK